jgi:DNA polymerase III delta subunit
MPKKASYNDLKTAIAKGKIEPVYFFYGKEDFLIDEIVELIRAKLFKSEADARANVTIMYGGSGADKTITLGDVLSAASAYGMFAEQKLIVVRDFEKIQKPKKDFQKAIYSALEAYVQNPL